MVSEQELSTTTLATDQDMTLTLATDQDMTLLPPMVPDRELIVRTPIITSVSTPAITSTTTNMITCPKCGTFKKSGRVSCCAPGGAWYRNCGGASNRNVAHR